VATHDDMERRRRHDADEADTDPGGGETTDERSVTSVPLETESGEQVVIRQQNVGPGNQVGGGEFKDAELATTPEQAAAEQLEREREAPIADDATRSGDASGTADRSR
jgi:hypothetical protein